MKKTLKRVFALMLSVLMLSSDLTTLLPKAEAAGGFATAPSDFSGTKDDYTAQNNGRPNLFVSFLGDNNHYPVGGTSGTAVGLGTVPTPGTYDMEDAKEWTQYTNAQVEEGTIFWVGVGVDRAELLKLLEDTDGDGTSGLTSFEAGFYYDAKVAEPYVGPDGFQATIEKYNLTSGNRTNTWDTGTYKILRAETGLDVQTDAVTQEELKNPSIGEITSNTYDTAQGGNTTGDWKMTYVSIELKNVESATRRLSGEYTGVKTDSEGKATVPNAANKTDGGYEYLLMIPFRLKSFDGATKRSHIRLIRNATHFSIGGEKYGVDPYGAWERVTERNLDHSIKLMTNFTGDLQLFAEGKAEEVLYDVQLIIYNGGGTANKAKLSVNGDPSVWTAYANVSKDMIRNLSSGLNMMLEVEREAGYTVEVTVDFPASPSKGETGDANGRIWWDLTDRYTKVTDNQMYYTFNMPQFDSPPGPVIVTVTFRYDNRENFKVYLSELQSDGTKNTDGNPNILSERKVGNQATVTVNQVASTTPNDPPVDDTPSSTKSINSFSPKAESHPSADTGVTGHSPLNHGLTPMIEAQRKKVVTVTVELHKDQQAVIKFYDFRSDTQHLTTNIEKLTWQDIPSDSYDMDWSAGELTLREGGSFAFVMPETDLDIEIIYEPAPQHKATLEVWHDGDKSDTADYINNTAQLVHTFYDDLNAAKLRYSGVVYEDYNATTSTSNHRAVKDPGYALKWVSASEAALSGSLGGDSGASGVAWSKAGPVTDAEIPAGQEAVMTVMAESADIATLAGKLTALDVRDVTVATVSGTTYTGLRKDLQGTAFADNDMTALAELLWEMRGRIEKDSTLQTAYYKEAMKASATSTKAYGYFNLTGKQVQAYLLETFRAEEYQRKNQRQYQIALQRYQTQLEWYNTWKDAGAYAGLVAPVEPTAPKSLVAGSTANDFVRSYQGKDYTATYMTDYANYMTAYEDYHAAVATANGTNGVALPAVGAPTAPDVVKMTVMSVSDAQNYLAANLWNEPDVADMNSPTIQTREGRTVYVALEADSQYEVKSVMLYDTSGNPLYQTGTKLVLNASKETGYQNIYSFQMPEQDCVVRVTYQKRGTVTLTVNVEGHDKVTGNVTNVEAYSAQQGSVTPKYNQVSNFDATTSTWENDPYTVKVEKVLQGSVVTVTVNTNENYKIASFTATASGGIGVYYTSAVSPINANQTVYTLTVPAGVGEVIVTVKYEPKDQKRNNAYIRTSGDLNSGLNNAFWLENGGYYQVLADQPEGKKLEAYITVRPGYYIESITAHGASGTYSYTVSGNGYNGGHGAMNVGGVDSRVKLTTTMPDETYYVDVVFKKGVPPTDPQQTLTLTVKDEENTDTAKYAKNWVKAEIYAAALADPTVSSAATAEQTMPTAGVYAGNVLGKHAEYGDGNLQDTKSVAMGKWVRVEFSADEGYYVSDVSASPSGLGLTLVWESSTVVSFYMPAGTCGVTVTFAKIPTSGLPTYKMRVRERVDTSTPNTMPQTNYITTVHSNTIKTWNTKALTLDKDINPEVIPSSTEQSASGVASAGETVTMTYTVDTSRYYVHSVQLLYPGGTRYLLDVAKRVGTDGTEETYQVTFPMPGANAEFVVDYRTGTPAKEKEYELMLRLIDLENEERLDSSGTKVYDDNRAKATFTSTVSPAPAALEVGKALDNHAGEVVGYQNVHPGDVVTITAQVDAAQGYNLEYVVVTPYSLNIYPAIATPTSPDVYEGSFVMPAENVTVLVKVSKSPKREYTANLILRAPNGEDIDTVGQGSFVKYGEGADGGNLGSIQDYYTNAIYSMIANPGTKYGLDLYAFPGYYIDAITIDPVDPTGATVSYTGNVGYQTGEFTMPLADVNVNVWFKKGWPDEIPYDMTLKVYDVTADGNKNPANYAYFDRVSGEDVENPDVYVYGNESHTLEDKARDNDTVVVRVQKETGYVYSVTVTDRDGNAVSWWYVPGGIAFTAPPSHVTVEVTFREAAAQKHTATLYLVDNDSTDRAELKALSTAATGDNPATVNGQTISNLEAGDALNLSALPGEGRHIRAVYAYNTTTGKTVPIYALENGKTYSDCVTEASFLPKGLPDTAGTIGQLAMPEGDIAVYVKYGAGTVDPARNPAVTLWVSGASGSGSADLEIEEDGKKIENLGATGMDTVYSEKDNTVTVTFNPTKSEPSGTGTGNDYAIAKLEVYTPDGTPVEYDWISMILDPDKYTNGTLSDPNTWPAPPSDPEMDTPEYVKNPKQQINLKVPAEGVIVHVTYEKVDKDKQYKIQVVVNDGQFVDTPPSKNDTWMNDPAGGTDKSYIRYEKAGSWVDLNVTVHPGYRIETFIAVPQGYGISPSLPLGNGYDQKTGLVMPAGDIVVYVKYVRDPAARKNATLVVTNDGIITNVQKNLNYATISSPISGTSAGVIIGGLAQSVVARPDTDWVTVDYYWNPVDTSVVSVTVKNVAGTVSVPFTQGVNEMLPNDGTPKGHGSIRLPMYSEDIVITVTYRQEKDPPKQKVNLHVIDETAGTIEAKGTDGGWARLQYTPTGESTVTGDTNEVPSKVISAANPEGNTYTLEIPAGETVNLSAFTGTARDGKTVYVKSAVVIYQQTGQVIHCNLRDGFGNAATNGSLSDSFTVHPGVNDVYVRLTTEEVAKDEHSVVLMLRGPQDDAGSASIQNKTQNTTTVPDDTTSANQGYAYTVAKNGENIEIKVIPAPGYVIDYVQITPLGFPLDTDTYDWERNGNNITFQMPHINVGILVVLKRGTSAKYIATLHYVKDTDTVDKTDNAQLYWIDDSGTKQSITADEDPATTYAKKESMEVKEGATVTLEGYLNGVDDVILSAYVLRNGALVPLSPTYPATADSNSGLEGVKNTEPLKADGAAEFIMPAENVDVYLVVTDNPPTRKWHTVVLITTDQKGTEVNSGKNEGLLWETDTPGVVKTAESFGNSGHVAFALTEMKSDGITPNTFSAQPVAAAEYEFQLPATASYNAAPYSANLTPKGLNPYLYEEAVGTRNTAVKMHFVAADKLKLTVEIEDRENPGDGTVTNAAEVSPSGGVPDDLALKSTTAFGAYQIMNGVTGGQGMSLTVKPAADYKAYARLTDLTGAVSDVELTKNADGTYSGSFHMPTTDTTLTVVFTRGYTGTLEIVDKTTDGTHQGSMNDTLRHSATTPYKVRVTTLTSVSSASLSDLPNGDTLVARMEETAGEAPYDLTALLTVKGSTRFMTAASASDGHDTVTHYDHTINRADAKITFVLTDSNVDPAQKDFVAAVTTVNAPDSSANLTDIANASDSSAFHGDVWTVAKEGNRLTISVKVPDGYEATVTTDGGTLTGSTTLTADGTLTLDMPAQNTLVTVTYKKVKFDLKLVITDRTGKNNTASVVGGADTLTTTGATTTANGGTTITVNFTPDTDVKATASYRADDGTVGVIAASSGTFSMPEADTTVYIRFNLPAKPGTSMPATRDYIAFTATENAGGQTDNRVTSIANLTDSTADTESPAWTAITSEDVVKVTFQTAGGYYATVEAEYLADNSPLPVSQIGTTGNGYATVQVPSGLENNVKITVVYSTAAPATTENTAALRLVKHDASASNSATLSAKNLSTIALSGASTGNLVVTTDPKSDVESQRSKVSTGDDLRTWATWGSGYQVTRVTLALRTGGTAQNPVETPEIDLPIAEYGGTVTARCDVPLLTSAGYIPVVRVYYGNIYEATLHIVGETAADTTAAHGKNTATGSTSNTSTGISPITKTGDKIIDLAGEDEVIRTQAEAGTNRRLVGVVWESPKTGANATTKAADGLYDFDMPKENVDFYVVYEDEPTDEKDKSYIARVAFQGTGHLGDSANQVSIRNDSDATAAGGKYWTAAKGGETVTVTVTVAAGYQARIITTKVDDPSAYAANGVTDGTADYHFYTSRTVFVPNAPIGKDSTFSMPVSSDATVTVEYTKGYDLELALTDVSGKATPSDLNSAQVNNTSGKLVQGESDGTSVAYDPRKATGLPGGDTLSTTLKHADSDVASRVLYSSALTGTLTLKGNSTDAAPVSDYTMPSANVVESVLFRDENAEDKLLAKVQLKGETDITGNHVASIVDKTDPTNTTTGSIWTTTAGGRTIDMTLTVAKGYVANIKVLRDDSINATDPTDTTGWKYLDAKDYSFSHTYTKGDGSSGGGLSGTGGAMTDTAGVYEVSVGYVDDATPDISGVTFAGHSSGAQHFTFTMPARNAGDTDTDVTVIVEFVYAGTIPQPYDPSHVNNDSGYVNAVGDLRPDFLKDGFIYGENRGDYAILDIPTLMQNDALFSTDQYTAGDASTNVTFKFFLRQTDTAGNESYVLLTENDVELVPVDEDTLVNAGDRYNYYTGQYKSPVKSGTTDADYTGSKFLLVPRETAGGGYTVNGQVYYDMLNDLDNTDKTDDLLGSLEKKADGSYQTRLYVIAENALGEQSGYTEVWIRPTFQLAAQVASYGPKHPISGTLYRHKTGNAALFKSYDAEPYLETGEVLNYDPTSYGERWLMTVKFRSSDLLGGWNKNYNPDPTTSHYLLDNVDFSGDMTYAFQVEKAGNITYTRVNLNLKENIPLSGVKYDSTTGSLPGYYTSSTLTFLVQDWIYLFAGSVRGEEQVKQAELDWLQDYLVRGKQYTTYATEAEAPDAASWRISIYNPDSWAYACDLDSNGHISQRDYDILTSRFNWLRTTSDYNWTKVDTSGKKTSTLPFGFGGGKTALGGDWSALFALDALEEAYPLDADPFWDAPGDGEEAELPGTYVDEEGNLLTEDQVEAGDAMRELEKLFNSADSTPQSPTSPGGLQDLIGDGEEQETPGGGMGSLPGTGIIAPLPPTDSATPEEEIQPDDDNLDGEPPAAEDSAPSGSSAGKENAWWEEEEEEPLR